MDLGVAEVSISSSQGQISLEVTMETETHSVDTCWDSQRGAPFSRPGVGNACVGVRRICILHSLQTY